MNYVFTDMKGHGTTEGEPAKNSYLCTSSLPFSIQPLCIGSQLNSNLTHSWYRIGTLGCQSLGLGFSLGLGLQDARVWGSCLVQGQDFRIQSLGLWFSLGLGLQDARVWGSGLVQDWDFRMQSLGLRFSLGLGLQDAIVWAQIIE